MRLALLCLALAAIVQGTQAQTSATVLIEDSTYYGSANGYMSTSFVGLRLPSGGGSVSITFAPGDYATNDFVTSYADETQAGPYAFWEGSTSITIGATGHYWVYLSEYATGTPVNFDWLEIRVEASTYPSTPTCYYCSPPSGWGTGWPPLATHQLVSSESPASNPLVSIVPGSASKNYTVIPKWVIPVLVVVIALAVLLPASYLVYRRVKANKTKAATPVVDPETSTVSTPETNESHVEMQPTVTIATAI